MAVLVPSINGHIHNQLTRSLERILEEANQSGELKLSNRKLKDFPKADKYSLNDTVIADLSKNRFSELPEEVTGFHFLERLQCYHNAIRFIPDTVCSLQCLSYLDLSRNQLTVLPRELCQLPIQILLVSNNRLTALPDDLYRMTRLTELDASCNQLSHFPARFGELRALRSLLLRSNRLQAVPVDLTGLDLVRLDLRANRISTLPVEMRDMDTLMELLVEDNPLTSPPASLCKRGRVHIFKYLETEAIKLERKTGSANGTLSRRSRRQGTGSSSPGPPHLADRLRQKRQNVDSGYSTSSDCCDKRWSQEMGGDVEKAGWLGTPVAVRAMESGSRLGAAMSEQERQWPLTPLLMRAVENGGRSDISTPSTISPTHEVDTEEPSKNSSFSSDVDRLDGGKNSARVSPCTEAYLNGSSNEDLKLKPLNQIQTYREYKEALKQQRAQDVPSIYRTKDPEDQSNKTEPNTPTHHFSSTTLATSRSDPTPLNSAFSSPKHIFDDTSNAKKPVQKIAPTRNNYQNQNINGNSLDRNNRTVHDYVKPKSPSKTSTGILSHDNVPIPNTITVNGKGSTSSKTNYLNGSGITPKSINGIKTARNISWKSDVTTEKMSFTMRREIDKAREETDLINQLRNIIETRLKMALPEDLAPALTDGVVLCHLANHIKPRSVASIHVPSPAVPKLTMARCRRNVDNFIEACRKIGVDENLICCAADVLEGKGLVQIAITVTELLRFHSPRSPLNSGSVV